MPVDRKYRVLIVDDERAVRLLLDRILAEAGYDTAVALDAADALRLQAEEKPFDLLLTAVLIPDMSGDEFVGRMRESQPELKALSVTGFADRLFWEKPVLDNEAFVGLFASSSEGTVMFWSLRPSPVQAGRCDSGSDDQDVAALRPHYGGSECRTRDSATAQRDL